MANFMANIDEITITRTQTGKNSLQIEWLLNNGEVFSYEGEYTLTITENGSAFFQKTFKATQPGQFFYQAQTNDFVSGRTYLAVLNAAGVEDTATLIVDSFSKLEGSFDGERFCFLWQMEQGKYMPQGVCTIGQADGQDNLSVPVKPYFGKLVYDGINCAGKDKLQAVFTATDGSINEGPDSAPLVFYPGGARILDAQLKSGDASETLDLILAHSVAGIEKVRLVFTREGAAFYQMDCVNVTEKDDSYLVSADVPHAGILPHDLGQCVVHCYFVNGAAVSAVNTPFCRMSLAVPEVEPLSRGEICTAYVVLAGEIAANGYEFSDKTIIHSASGKCPADFKARACYDIENVPRRGPWSRPGFKPCYYVENGVVSYKEASFGDNTVKSSFPAAWFHGKDNQPVTVGVFTLTPGEKSYELSIDTSKAADTKDYDSFLDAVKDIMLPQAFYAITETVLRKAGCLVENLPYYLCGFMPAERRCDLRPGLLMQTDTALYLPAYDTKVKNLPGFVWANTGKCRIGFSGKSGFLEFNSFAADMLGRSSISPSEENLKTVYASGILDLLRPSLKQPYFRLLYPSSFPKMDTSLPYPSQNTVLMAADSYGKLLDACRRINEDPNAINDLSIPLVVFRGRGIVSLQVEIFVNGNSVQVPVGSTIEQMLGERGILETGNVKLQRRSYEGRILPVYGDISGMALISGDWLQVL